MKSSSPLSCPLHLSHVACPACLVCVDPVDPRTSKPERADEVGDGNGRMYEMASLVGQCCQQEGRAVC